LGALEDIRLLHTCCTFLLPKIEQGEEEALSILKQSGSTGAINSLRAFRVQRIVIVIGMFSLLEATLKMELEWEEPFRKLPSFLKDRGKVELALKFEYYRLANNVLKHGTGDSWDKLREYSEKIDFELRDGFNSFNQEGDITSGHALVDVDSKFVLHCADMIEEINREVFDVREYE